MSNELMTEEINELSEEKRKTVGGIWKRASGWSKFWVIATAIMTIAIAAVNGIAYKEMGVFDENMTSKALSYMALSSLFFAGVYVAILTLFLRVVAWIGSYFWAIVVAVKKGDYPVFLTLRFWLTSLSVAVFSLLLFVGIGAI